MWSCGVVLYIMLCGFPPFDDQDENLFDKIKCGHYTMPSPYWNNISNDAKNLVKNLMQIDPKKIYCKTSFTTFMAKNCIN